MSELYIGLMSGTSINAIDAVLVDFTDSSTDIVDSYTSPLPNSVREALYQLCRSGSNEIHQASEWDHRLGHLFADAALALLKRNNQLIKQIKAIGSHGQTIRHCPNNEYPYTLQIGDPNIIAEKTGITTIADFRRRDIACGGQGAPLVPAFHEYLFKGANKNRVILNLGGIANITWLAATQPTFGFDTGPANTLLDHWIRANLNQNYDDEGSWAASGTCQIDLLEAMLKDSYFNKIPPKSTGLDYFNLAWLNQYLKKFAPFKAEDVQATLVALTTNSIMQAIDNFCTSIDEMIVCGGGSKNLFLMKQLEVLGKKRNFNVTTSSYFGIDPEWIEATAFAWLARQTFNKLPGNSIHTTGAKRQTILGGIYYA